jgi:dienelactone hydrolase
MHRLALVLVFAVLLPVPAGADTGWRPAQVLAAPSALADDAQFIRRLLSPLAADDLARFVQARDRRLAPEPLAEDERINLFIPDRPPPQGYGLIVFVHAGDEFFLPHDWRRELSRRGLIFATLIKAGNDADVFGRRIPLVLHAYRHVLDHYPVDEARVYVSGFSGGGRLAQRVALGYPDVFSGSLQFAGSVVIGENLMPPPPAELMTLFQSRTRVVMATGNLDRPNRRNDELSRDRMAELCVAGVSMLSLPGLEHWTPDGRGLSKALELLETPVEANAVEQSHCNARLQARIDAFLDAAAQASEEGRRQEAVDAIVAVDDAFGGLALPRTRELARSLMSGVEPQPDGAVPGTPR